MEQLQSQLRAVESRDRSIMESNFERVNFWSFVNLFVMIFVSGLQVSILEHFERLTLMDLFLAFPTPKFI